MRAKALVFLVAVVCAVHGQISGAALAQAPVAGGDAGAKERAKDAGSAAEARPTPVPVAKPATPAPEPEKPQDGEAKPGEPAAPGSRAAQGSGPLPVGSGERAFDAPDCRWTGTRVVSRLMGEDVDAASQFTRFYSLFGCPTPHISRALSCMVAWEGDRKAQHEMIDDCWKDPARKRTAAAPAAEATKEPAKPGAEDKPPPKN